MSRSFAKWLYSKHITLSDCSSWWNIIFLQLLHDFKAHSLPLWWDLNKGSRILHTLNWRSQEKQWQKYLRLIKCSRSKPTNEITMRPFCWSSRSNPPTVNIIAKPRTNRKRRTWWCTTVHQVHLFINVPPRNNGQHEFVLHVHIALAVGWVSF